MNQYKNQKAFLALLQVGLWGEQRSVQEFKGSKVQDSIGWEKIYQLAQEQSVQGLLLQGIEELKAKGLELNVPKILLLQWIGEVQVIEQRNKDMNIFIADLIEKLRKADIYVLLVKGQGVAQCYEKPLWRSCGDVDLFLSDENYKKAKNYLIPFASSVEKEAEATQHLGMTIDGWVVELHGKLNGNLSSRVKNLLEGIKRETFYGGQVRSWINEDTQIFLMKEENEILYSFIHFLNHFYKEGVGLRQICDWCRLLYTYKDSLNYGLLEQRIKRAGLVSEWKAFGALAIEYLGMPKDSMPLLNFDVDLNARSAMPLGLSKNLKRKADRIMELVLESGNFGHNKDLSYRTRYSGMTYKIVAAWRRLKDFSSLIPVFPVDAPRFYVTYVMGKVKGK